MTGIIYVETGNQYPLEGTNSSARVYFGRAGDDSGPVTVSYGVTSSEATIGSDYLVNGTTNGSGQVTIGAGSSSNYIDINILNDSDQEDYETIVVSIISVDSGSLAAPRTTRVTILDDESGHTPPPPYPNILTSEYDVTLDVSIGGYSNIRQPVDIEFLPGEYTAGVENLAYVVGREGIIQLVDFEDDQRDAIVLDIQDKVNRSADRGLMSIELDPDFANNGYVYAFYVVDPPGTASNSGNAGQDGDGNRFSYVSRFTADLNTYQIDPNSEFILLGEGPSNDPWDLNDISGNGALDYTLDIYPNEPESGRDPNTGVYYDDYLKVDAVSHAGGGLAFGPDGMLYVSTGDGTSYNYADPRSPSVQELDSLAGKILRVDPATGDGLTDNPFYDSNLGLDANRNKVYQLGLRNPFSISFSPDDELYIANTGWGTWDELEKGTGRSQLRLAVVRRWRRRPVLPNSRVLRFYRCKRILW